MGHAAQEGRSITPTFVTSWNFSVASQWSSTVTTRLLPSHGRSISMFGPMTLAAKLKSRSSAITSRSAVLHSPAAQQLWSNLPAVLPSHSLSLARQSSSCRIIRQSEELILLQLPLHLEGVVVVPGGGGSSSSPTRTAQAGAHVQSPHCAKADGHFRHSARDVECPA